MVAADLRGYGDSGKPHGDPEHLTYAKRAMAQDQVEVMQQLGFETFNVVTTVGRACHRLTLDHPQRCQESSPCWISFRPTRCSASSIRRWRHRRITGSSSSSLTTCPKDLSGQFPNAFCKIRGRTPEAHAPEALAEYIRCFDAATIHATCEDYRAGASIDLVYDEADLNAGKKVTCPLFVLWSAKGYVGRTQDVLQIWRDYATDVRGQSLPCGHFLAEEMPDETYTIVRSFLLGKE